MSPATAAALADATASVMRQVLARAGRRPPWIDTRIDTIDGGELPPDRDDAVYAWIQGRAVEALCLHAPWFAARGEDTTARECLRLAGRVALALEHARSAGGGRLRFRLRRDGSPLPAPADPSQCGFADLFHARGLAALAASDPHWAQLASQRRAEILAALAQGRFVSDQEALDARNRVGEVPGRRSFGGAMIAVGLCALAVRSGDVAAVAAGDDLVDGILTAHADLPQVPPDTLCEFIAADGAPWREAGEVLSDPGHACELVGLALWLVHEARRRRAACPALEARIPALGRILATTVALGFTGAGLVKHWSLSSRRAVNDDMPWWSLPETVRAAVLLRRIAPATADACGADAIRDRCAQAFVDGYINPAAHGWAVQTLGADGRPVRRIPATPDADPGYHTGCCLIAALSRCD